MIKIYSIFVCILLYNVYFLLVLSQDFELCQCINLLNIYRDYTFHPFNFSYHVCNLNFKERRSFMNVFACCSVTTNSFSQSVMGVIIFLFWPK